MNYELFIKNPSEYKQLTIEEFKELFIKFKNGDDVAYNKLFMHNLNLVIYEINHKFYSSSYDKQELIQVGSIGLVNALNGFDITKDNQFSTYAIKCIDNIIYRYIKKLDYTNSINEIIYINELGEELTLEDALPSDANLQEEYLKKEKNEQIIKIINNLKPREQEIIKMYFGFYDKDYTMQEIGIKFNMTKSNVSRIIQAVLKRLRETLSNNQNLNYRNIRTIKIKSIYELFDNYSKEEIDKMISKLDEEDKKLLRLRYGDDLENPVTSSEWTEDKKLKFYRNLLPKMKKILSKKELKQSISKIISIYDCFSGYSKEEIDYAISLLKEEDKRIIYIRYGFDLDKTIILNDLTDIDYYNLYGLIIPKIKRRLDKNKHQKVKKLN